jgi:hypothetical protein
MYFMRPFRSWPLALARARRSDSFEPDHAPAVTIEMKRRAGISGRVSRMGQPVVNAAVSVLVNSRRAASSRSIGTRHAESDDLTRSWNGIRREGAHG